MRHSGKHLILLTSLLVLAMTIMAACATPPVGTTSDATAPTSQDTQAGTAATDRTGQQSAAGAESDSAAATDSVAQATTSAPQATSNIGTVARPAGWTEASHSNDADLDYATVFPDDQVNRIVITFSPENWAAMQEDMTSMYGEAGSRQQFGGGMPGGMPGQDGMPGGMPDQGGMPGGNDRQPPQAGGMELPDRPGGGMGGGMNVDMTVEDPIWVTATVEFEDQTWTNVGFRYKGNSSLLSAWNSGTTKMPFKLNFDKFEDDYPEIDNQRFFGFDTLSFATNFSDSSALRETIAYDLLEAAGLPASQTGFYEVYFDYGEGPMLAGLYTMVEETDDTVIKGYFGDDNGNIYKPEGEAATLAAGVSDGIAEAFVKKNNEKEADWSDIQALYDVLHSDQRTSDPEAWRASLEAIFDVDSFLRTMALYAIMEHWDTYGQMTHNFYLYDDPTTGQLTWISWDLNMILGTGGGGGGRGGAGDPAGQPNAGQVMPGGAGDMGRPGGRGNITLDRAEVTDTWPLIRYLLDDPVYFAQYAGHVSDLAENVFVADQLTARVQALAELIAPYAAEEDSQQAFDTAVQQLIARIQQRSEATAAFLAEQ